MSHHIYAHIAFVPFATKNYLVLPLNLASAIPHALLPFIAIFLSTTILYQSLMPNNIKEDLKKMIASVDYE